MPSNTNCPRPEYRMSVIHACLSSFTNNVLFIPEFLNNMNAEAMEHLPNCCNLTFEENCDRPRVIVGHVVQEPTARRRGAVKL